MRFASTLTTLVIAAPLAAQNWYVPDSDPATSVSCNAIPFGSTVGGGGYQSKYQVKATRADLGALPGLITGLGFAPCGTGTSHFASIEVVLDHHPAGTPLSTTFAANLTANAVRVLYAINYRWNTTANTWNELGLQNFFAYSGNDDLVIQITCVNGTSPAGFHRGARQRVYWTAASGSPPAAGTSSLAAGKFEVGMVMARISSHGIGCLGTNGMPTHNTSGTPMLTQTVGVGLTNGSPGGAAILLFGFNNGVPPYPFELSAFGMPLCWFNHDIVASRFVVLDGTGAGSFALTIPNDGGLLAVKLYSQYACIDPTANAAGITTSNYNRILIGN